jgi:hypothetical protein
MKVVSWNRAGVHGRCPLDEDWNEERRRDSSWKDLHDIASGNRERKIRA